MGVDSIANVDLEVVSGGTQGFLHPPPEDKPRTEVNAWLRDKGGDWTSCTGGFWTGCPPKQR